LRQPQEIVRVPCVDHLGIGLQRALSENRIIDRATGEARGSGSAWSPLTRRGAGMPVNVA
jgi:hypothetical protein